MKHLTIMILVLGLTACTTKYSPKMVQHIRGSVFGATDHGYYTAELVMRPKKPGIF